MKFKTFMVAKVIVCLSLGVPILFSPVFLYGLFGTVLGAGGALVGRERGINAWSYVHDVVGAQCHRSNIAETNPVVVTSL